MAQLQLRLLGGFDLKAGPGQDLPIKLKKAQALLAYLACHPGQSHPRDKLATLLWPERDDRQARANLRKVLYVLRSRLSLTSPSLGLDEDTVTLDTAALDVDVLAFQRLARRTDPEALQQAVDLYRGDLLEGFGVTEAPFEEWLSAERERLREHDLEALAKLLAHQTKSEESDAVATALRLLALDPLQEAVHRALMRLYVRDGRRDAALRQYQSCVETLRRELSVEPEAETRELYQEVLRSRATPSKATRTAMARLDVLAPPVRHPPSPLPDGAPMFGRLSELTRLRHALAEALAGRGQWIAVLGEAGIGKSRLVSQVTVEAVKRGALALVSHGYQTEQSLAYGLWIDALRGGGVLDRDDVLSGIAVAWRAELARLFPELAQHDARPASSPEDATRLFEAVGHLLERLATAQPLLLVLEDVHWADEASIRLTSVLSRRIASWPILIVLTAREEEVAEAPVLRDLLRLPNISRLPLGPLSQEDTTALVQSLAPRGRAVDAASALAERIWGASNGNPFVVVETLRALEQGALPTTTADALGLPERVREVVMVRLERLSERGQALVTLAAVIGREFEFELLQRASGLRAHEAANAVEELVRRQMLRTVGDRFKVVHDWVREVVYGALLPIRRQLLHRDVAEALETLYASDLEPHLTALGLHYHGGEVWEKAVTFLQRAGVQAMTRSANREAVGLFEQALAALEHAPDTSETLRQAVDVRFDLRNALFALGDFPRMTGHLRDAETLSRRLDDPHRLGRTSVYLSASLWVTGRSAEVPVFGLDARAIAERLADLELGVGADFYLGLAYHGVGDGRAAEARLRAVLAALPGERFRERCGLAGFPAVMARCYLTMVLADRGAFGDGLAVGEQGVRLAETLDHPYSRIMAWWGLGHLYEAKGELSHGVDVLTRANALCRERKIDLLAPLVSGFLGFLCALSDDLDKGFSLMHEARRAMETMGLATRYHTRLLGHLSEVSLTVGRLADARDLARQTLLLARERSERATELYALQLSAAVAAHPAAFNHPLAEASYRDALALADALGLRPSAARCHLGLGKLCLRVGARKKGRQHLAHALAMFREMDMRSSVEQAETELRDVGQRN
jgi:DNA-binding SARP family transcriptional activator